MAVYYVYGRREGDKQFKALDGKGIRVAKKDAEVFTSKEEAQAFINAHKLKNGAECEVRKG